jgi:ATP-dependent Clp protease ATP-binding subunit ClpB
LEIEREAIKRENDEVKLKELNTEIAIFLLKEILIKQNGNRKKNWWKNTECKS